MKLEILKEKFADAVVVLSDDGGDETANIINPKGNGNIIVTCFPAYPEPYTVYFRTLHRNYTGMDYLLNYVGAIISEQLSVVEICDAGKPCFAAEITSDDLLNMTIDGLAEYFGCNVDELVGKQCRIRSWKGSFDADLEVVVQ